MLKSHLSMKAGRVIFICYIGKWVGSGGQGVHANIYSLLSSLKLVRDFFSISLYSCTREKMVQRDSPFLCSLHVCSLAIGFARGGLEGSMLIESGAHVRTYVYISMNPRQTNAPCFPKIAGRNEKLPMLIPA